MAAISCYGACGTKPTAAHRLCSSDGLTGKDSGQVECRQVAGVSGVSTGGSGLRGALRTAKVAARRPPGQASVTVQVLPFSVAVAAVKLALSEPWVPRM